MVRTLSHGYLRYSDIKTMALLYESEDFYSPFPSGKRLGTRLFPRIPPAPASMSGNAIQALSGTKYRVKSVLRLPALREAAAPTEGAAFAELQKTAAIRAFGAETKVVLVAALGAIG